MSNQKINFKTESELQEAIVKDKQIEKHLIHPIITGENLSKRVINWDKKVIIYPYRNQNGKSIPIELDAHPSIKQHLISHKQQLLERLF